MQKAGEAPTRYNSYVYRPGQRNVISLEELAEIKAADKEISKTKMWSKYDENHPRPKRNPFEVRAERLAQRRSYREQNKERINKAQNEQRKAKREAIRHAEFGTQRPEAHRNSQY